MPKYYCDYCDTYLTHDSPSVRKTHCQGRKHKENVKFYYQKWMEDQAQQLIDATTALYRAGKISANPFQKGTAIPPPASIAVPPNGLPAMPAMAMSGIPQGIMSAPPGTAGMPPGVGMIGPPMMRPAPPMMMPMPSIGQMPPSLLTNHHMNLMPQISK